MLETKLQQFGKNIFSIGKKAGRQKLSGIKCETLIHT